MVEGLSFMLAASKNSEEKKRTLINVHLFSFFGHKEMRIDIFSSKLRKYYFTFIYHN